METEALRECLEGGGSREVERWERVLTGMYPFRGQESTQTFPGTRAPCCGLGAQPEQATCLSGDVHTTYPGTWLCKGLAGLS